MLKINAYVKEAYKIGEKVRKVNVDNKIMLEVT